MRLIEFNKLGQTDVNLAKKLSDFIKQNCSEFLLANSSKAALWRGFNFNDIPSETLERDTKYFLSSSRDDRQPMSSDADAQRKIDANLVQMGYDALRSNSIFCTGDIRQADGYGDRRFAVFPLNGFNFSWNTCYKDLLTMGIGKFRVKEYKYALEMSKKEPYVSLTPYKTLIDLDNMSASEFISTYKFSKENLNAALNSDHEILINGKFLAVESDLFDQINLYLI